MIRIGNNNFLGVTPNLSEALYHLRRDEPLVLWIDALCIDQQTMTERNSQVGIMGEIFSHASLVHMWLGNFSLPPIELDHSLFSSLQIQNRHKTMERTDRDDNEILGKIRTHIQTLLSQPWFTRIWAVQEIVLAKKAWIHVGYDRMPWETLVAAVEYYLSEEQAGEHVSKLHQRRFSGPQTLLETVCRFHKWESTDPLD